MSPQRDPALLQGQLPLFPVADPQSVVEQSVPLLLLRQPQELLAAWEVGRDWSIRGLAGGIAGPRTLIDS